MARTKSSGGLRTEQRHIVDQKCRSAGDADPRAPCQIRIDSGVEGVSAHRGGESADIGNTRLRLAKSIKAASVEVRLRPLRCGAVDGSVELPELPLLGRRASGPCCGHRLRAEYREVAPLDAEPARIDVALDELGLDVTAEFGAERTAIVGEHHHRHGRVRSTPTRVGHLPGDAPPEGGAPRRCRRLLRHRLPGRHRRPGGGRGGGGVIVGAHHQVGDQGSRNDNKSSDQDEVLVHALLAVRSLRTSMLAFST